jgi:PhnB protein
MKTQLNPYIGFKNNARAAMEFYQSVFGGKVLVNTFKDFNVPVGPDESNLIMHSVLEAENGIKFMAADSPARMEYKTGTSINLALTGDNAAELRSYFEKLSAGGKISQPLTKADWGDTFGMCTDKFGIDWYVNIIAQKP